MPKNKDDLGYLATVNEFCYLGSIIQDDSSCDKDIRARLGQIYGGITASVYTQFRL